MAIYAPLVMYGLRLFIVLQTLQCLLHVIIFRDVGFYHFTNICCSVALNLPVSEIVHILPEAAYCCTLFTTMFTVIFVVCSLKSMCVPSFVLIGCCVSQLLSHPCSLL